VAKKDPPKASEKPAPSETPAPTRAATAAATGSGTNAEGTDRNSTEKGSGRAGAPNGAAVAAERQTYYASVGERFRVTWNLYKPLVGEGSGQELTARVHIKISPTGSVQQITLTRSTGNQEVDTSIERAFKDFKSVGAPPAILLQSGQFESDMAIILTI
jgi:TonB family protein